ncbi:MAG: hypothetical protein H5T63_07055 [Chloroflexi bacterium]|nr:hypothetical protein [Chloroflexota bacterium]
MEPWGIGVAPNWHVYVSDTELMDAEFNLHGLSRVQEFAPQHIPPTATATLTAETPYPTDTATATASPTVTPSPSLIVSPTLTATAEPLYFPVYLPLILCRYGE